MDNECRQTDACLCTECFRRKFGTEPPTALSRGRSWDKANEARVTAIEAMTPDQMRDMLMWIATARTDRSDRYRYGNEQ